MLHLWQKGSDDVNYVKEYYSQIEKGEIVACEEIKSLYKRLVKEMDCKDDSFPFYFSERHGNHAIEFIETFCKHYQGEHAGEFVKLELFQKAFIQSLFGWLEKETDCRRFREYFFEVTRKHGKSFLSACIAVYMLVADGEDGAEVYSAATKLDQAKIIYNAAKNVVDQSKELNALVKSTREGLYFKMTRSLMKPLPNESKSLDGLNIHFAALDEIHEQNVYVLQHYFLPQGRIDKLELTQSKEAPYKLWAEQGWLTINEGASVDYSNVTKWFVRMVTEYDIRPLWICYDRALSGYWVPEMEEYGFEMEKTAQGPFTWSQPMKEMGGAFTDHVVVYQNNPILRWCLANTAKKSTNKDGIESIQPVKIQQNRRIDGMVSLLNAWVGYVKHYGEYMPYVR